METSFFSGDPDLDFGTHRRFRQSKTASQLSISVISALRSCHIETDALEYGGQWMQGHAAALYCMQMVRHERAYFVFVD